MSLPKSLVQPLRKGQLMVGSGWRSYFAPFNAALAEQQSSTILGPTIYDLEVTSKFIDSTSPPSGWFDLGYIKNFKFTPGSKVGAVKTGYRGVTRAKYRAEIEEKVSLVFKEASRMATKIATGSQVFNLLYSTASASTSSPVGSSGMTACAMGASGYQVTGAGSTSGSPTLFVPSGSGSLFSAGQYIVCDQDYNGTDYGLVGDNAVNLFQSAATDTDFIRKTSDYVACIKSISTGVLGQDALVLTGPFVGGGNAIQGATVYTAPRAGAKVQRVVGFAQREGGTTLTEWSGIFVRDYIDGSQTLLYYPHLSPDSFGGFDDENLEGASSLQSSGKTASFEALGFDDPIDGETVVRYMAYYPAPNKNLQI